ncbi:MAG: putative DNA binding protein [Natrialbaceae archaeon]|jgi:predicted DNA binding protein
MFVRFMTRATLTISIPVDLWIGRVSRSHPDADITILSAFPGDETATGLVEVSGPDVHQVIDAFDDEELVTTMERLNRGEEAVLVQIETSEPTLLFPIIGSGIPLELPFTIREGLARWTVTTSHDRLSELGEQLNAFDIPYTLHALENDHAPEEILTDDQQQMIQAGIEEGYYDTPRTCTLTELAETLGIAKSTCSEKLHRAESKIVREFATGEADDPVEPERHEIVTQ